MKYLKSFNESKFNVEECIEGTYTINPDGSYDVIGNVYLHNKGLTKIPVKFNMVTGYFNCSENKLTSLEGCPKEVGGDPRPLGALRRGIKRKGFFILNQHGPHHA